MYEKTKLQQSASDSYAERSELQDAVCAFCDRMKSIVVCNSCGHSVTDARVRRKCIKHPKIFFLMNMDTCNECKSKDLLEVGLDDIPPHLLDDFQFTMTPFTDVSQPGAPPSVPFAEEQVIAICAIPEQPDEELMDVVEERATLHQPLQSVLEPVPQNSPMRGERGIKRSRIAIPKNFQSKAQASFTSSPIAVAEPENQSSAVNFYPAPAVSSSGCVCQREVNYVLCSGCGYFQTGVRKFIPCPVHPQEKQGLKFCPECGAPGSENLDEEV